MKVLTFTTLFPNHCNPDFCVFVKNRMHAVNQLPGVEVVVVAPVPWFPPVPFFKKWYAFSKIPKHEVIDGIEVYHPRYLVTPKVGMSLYGFSMFICTFNCIKQLRRKFSFNLIDAHFAYPDGFAATLLGYFFHRPVVISVRGTDINLYPQFSVIKKLLRITLSRADHLVAVSRSLGELMVAEKADRRKITIIPNGIDPLNFYFTDPQYARQKLGLTTPKKILVTVGGLIERKGMHLLLDAIHLLKTQGKADFKTYVIGKGEMMPLLEKKILMYGLEEQVELLGHIANEDLVDWYNAANLFFLGSSREGWPNVVCEAQACGLPVVATSVNGIPEILDSDNLGIMVERTPEAFAQGIDQALKRDWDREKIAVRGRKRTWEEVGREVHDLLTKVLNHAQN